jgi:hypothetical protein
VATAIEIRPEDILIFTKAALCAAPGQVEQIVFSASKAAPASCADVSLVAAKQLPSANNLILSGLTLALPFLQPCLEKAETEVGTNNFEDVITRTAQLYNNSVKTTAK